MGPVGDFLELTVCEISGVFTDDSGLNSPLGI